MEILWQTISIIEIWLWEAPEKANKWTLLKPNYSVPWHTLFPLTWAYSSGRGQVVNSTDQRGPLPIEPIDPSAPLRHGEQFQFTCGCRSGAQWSELPRPPKLWQDWSALVRAKCELPILMHRQYEHTRSIWRESCWLHGESGSIHFCCACSHSCACICHKLLHWRKHNMCCWICCTRKWAFIFSFIPEMEERLAITCRWRLYQ